MARKAGQIIGRAPRIWLERVYTGDRRPHHRSVTRLPFPTLLKYTVRYIDIHMATWKVIALINGEIEAVSGSPAQDRPGAHEWMVWQGAAADKAEALQSAEKADSRVNLEWMRIRYERDLDVG